MINRKELAICKRRGHTFQGLVATEHWRPCLQCGIWVREVRTLQESEVEPPEDQIDPLILAARDIAATEKTMKRLTVRVGKARGKG
jgi:hypothetical protein